MFWIFHTLKSESLRTSTELHGHIIPSMISGGKATLRYDTWYKKFKEWKDDFETGGLAYKRDPHYDKLLSYGTSPNPISSARYQAQSSSHQGPGSSLRGHS
jgi:hypothetical protein